mgnify:FL=1
MVGVLDRFTGLTRLIGPPFYILYTDNKLRGATKGFPNVSPHASPATPPTNGRGGSPLRPAATTPW